MLIIPSIDLLQGQAVRLYRGAYDQVTEYGDPREWLRRWKDAGASIVHVVDLAGARDGVLAEIDLVGEMAKMAVPLQVGGGVRQPEQVERLLEAGASRVVVGTQAVKRQDIIERILVKFGPKIVAALDSREGRVAIQGWHETTEATPVSLARTLSRLGVERFLVTDVRRDGALAGPNLQQIRQVVEAIPGGVIASGGVSSLDDVKRLRDLGAEAAIIGRALYDGLLDLGEAQETADAG